MASLAGKRWLLASCLASYFCSIMLIYQMSPFFQPYAKACCGATPDIVGVIFAALPFSSFVGSLAMADFLGRMGAQASLAGGLLALAASTIGFGLSDSLHGFFFWRVCQGLSSAAVYTSISTAMAQAFAGPGTFAFVIGLQEIWGNLGFSVGPLIGALLYQWGGFLAPFAAGAIFHVLLVAVTWRPCGASRRGTPLLEDSEKTANNLVSWREIASYRGQLWLCGAAVVAIGSWGCIEPTLAVHFEASLGITAGGGMGLLFGVSGIFSVFGSAVTVQLMDCFGGVAVTVAGLLQLALGCALLALTDPTAGLTIPQPSGPPAPLGIPVGHPAMWVLTYTAMILINVGYALAWTPVLPLMMELVQAQLGEDRRDPANGVSSIFNAAVAIGEAAGPIVGGAMSDLHGFAGTSMSPAIAALLYAGALTLRSKRMGLHPRSGSFSLHTPLESIGAAPCQIHQRSAISGGFARQRSDSFSRKNTGGSRNPPTPPGESEAIRL